MSVWTLQMAVKRPWLYAERNEASCHQLLASENRLFPSESQDDLKYVILANWKKDSKCRAMDSMNWKKDSMLASWKMYSRCHGNMVMKKKNWMKMKNQLRSAMMSGACIRLQSIFLFLNSVHQFHGGTDLDYRTRSCRSDNDSVRESENIVLRHGSKLHKTAGVLLRVREWNRWTSDLETGFLPFLQ